MQPSLGVAGLALLSQTRVRKDLKEVREGAVQGSGDRAFQQRKVAGTRR